MTRADKRKFHYIYKITRNDGSGKYYIGMHSTDDLEDGYFGSGQLLWRSIKKHGKEKHSKEILEFLPSRAALKLREKELVNEEIVDDKLCMNLKLGGEGGWDHIKNQAEISPLGRAAFKKRLVEDAEFAAEFSKKSSDNMKAKHASGKIKYDTFTGRKHSEETKKKISESRKKKQSVLCSAVTGVGNGPDC